MEAPRGGQAKPERMSEEKNKKKEGSLPSQSLSLKSQ
jgi:hypothetical protein